MGLLPWVDNYAHIVGKDGLKPRVRVFYSNPDQGLCFGSGFYEVRDESKTRSSDFVLPNNASFKYMITGSKQPLNLAFM